MTSPIKQRLAAAYAAWHDSRGKTPMLLFELMAEHIEIRSILGASLSDHDLGRVYSGRAAAIEYYTAIAEGWEMISGGTEALVEEGDRIVWVGRVGWRNHKTLRSFECPKVDVWAFADGKAISYLEMLDSYGFAHAIGLIDPPDQAD
ncbi:MAG: nuclear transport factor 2 family protein [Sphingomonadales bacterium]|nr:nuclear transport factor 2 family protein [Sphingomonadales bacterium]MBD3775225.1 nuclear transport factor 2 family protein [Paracoccaceae bacterium]